MFFSPGDSFNVTLIISKNMNVFKCMFWRILIRKFIQEFWTSTNERSDLLLTNP